MGRGLHHNRIDLRPPTSFSTDVIENWGTLAN